MHENLIVAERKNDVAGIIAKIVTENTREANALAPIEEVEEIL